MKRKSSTFWYHFGLIGSALAFLLGYPIWRFPRHLEVWLWIGVSEEAGDELARQLYSLFPLVPLLAVLATGVYIYCAYPLIQDLLRKSPMKAYLIATLGAIMVFLLLILQYTWLVFDTFEYEPSSPTWMIVLYIVHMAQAHVGVFLGVWGINLWRTFRDRQITLRFAKTVTLIYLLWLFAPLAALPALMLTPVWYALIAIAAFALLVRPQQYKTVALFDPI